jgi:methyl-accepting chemotaxis protein
MNFSNLRIGTRLGAGFGVVVVLLALITGIGITELVEEHTTLKALVEQSGQRLEDTANLRGAVSRRAIVARNLVLLKDPSQIAVERSVLERSQKVIDEALTNLNRALETHTDVTAEHRSLAAAIVKVEGTYGPLARDIVAAAAAGRTDEAIRRMNEECRPQLVALLDAIESYLNHERRLEEALVAEASSKFVSTRTTMLVLGFLAIAGAIALAIAITRSITAPLAQVSRAAVRVRDGDLTQEVEVRGKDEVADVLLAIREMQHSLRRVVGEVRTGVDSVSTASSQIAAGNQDLSNRTEQQAGSLQQTASAMEELTATVRQSADNARQANQLASAASEAASKGGAVVGQVVSTMNDITASSKKIADIISVIDGIAFQTNILALNAAVEAARAGEQGRGFAVVAGEVRNLAQRSAQAAREIKSLIGESVEKVEAGSRQVNDAGAAMSEIVSQVKRVTDLIGEISSAAGEQSAGIGQVNESVTNMDQSTQQNAALVEQSAAAAASLRDQAERLMQAVSVFKLAQSETHSAIAQAQASSRSTASAAVPARKPATTARKEAAKPATPARKPAPPVAKPSAPPAAASDDWQEF